MTDLQLASNAPIQSLAAKRYKVALFGDEWSGPATYLAAERDRLRALTWQHLQATMLSPTVGAEITGVDLTGELSDAVVAEIAAALAAYKVIFFREQPLTAEQHVAFARRFGELEVHPFIPPNSAFPELARFEKTAEVAGYENSWHHDVTWREIPSKAAILHGIHVPDVGGDTLFSDMCAAYDALEDELKELIDPLDAEHDFAQSFGRHLSADRAAEMRERYPLVTHPVAPRHPVTGRRALYVNRNFTSRIVGLEPEDSDRLLRRLCRQAEIVEHQVRFRWKADSVAMWDNLAVQHYASSDYWPDRRIMERASVIGTRPSR